MQQLREAFPWDQAPRYLLRDRNAIYGSEFAAITKGMGVVPGQSLADPKPHSFILSGHKLPALGRIRRLNAAEAANPPSAIVNAVASSSARFAISVPQDYRFRPERNFR
jgi:hypothetical protein